MCIPLSLTVADVIYGDADAFQAIQSSQVENLSILPANHRLHDIDSKLAGDDDAQFYFEKPDSRSVDIKRMNSAKWIPIRKIIADPNQPRKSFIDSSLKEIALSIDKYGVRQPIVVEYDIDAD